MTKSAWGNQAWWVYVASRQGQGQERAHENMEGGWQDGDREGCLTEIGEVGAMDSYRAD
jgi:hypothetical protein